MASLALRAIHLQVARVSGSEEECGRKPGIQNNITDLHQGWKSYLSAGLWVSCHPALPPAFLFSHQSVPKSRLATARNCGVIAPGNHWIYDSLRGAPPPGEAIWRDPRNAGDGVPYSIGAAIFPVGTPLPGCPDHAAWYPRTPQERCPYMILSSPGARIGATRRNAGDGVPYGMGRRKDWNTIYKHSSATSTNVIPISCVIQ